MGQPVCKYIRLSFFVLRCSTLVSALIGFAFLNKLILQISGNKNLALLACFVLMFNPLLFNLSNTFMTDVIFNTLCIICYYFLYDFLRGGKITAYLFFVLFSVGIVLLRQYGAVFPACFVLASFFVGEKKWMYVGLAIISLVIAMISLKQFEGYLSEAKTAVIQYKYSGNIRPFEKVFWINFLSNFNSRHREIFIHLLVYPMPLAVAFLAGLLKQIKTPVVFVLLVLDLGLTFCLFKSTGLSSESTFSNAMLGNESFYESVQGGRHNSYPKFDEILFYIKWISAFVTLFVVSLALTAKPAALLWKRILTPDVLALILLILSYTVMILVTESYFDRYHLPLITFAIILISNFGRAYQPAMAFSPILIVFWAYISLAGTKDYLTWNRWRWDAYLFIRRELYVPMDMINGGGEVNCWHEGDGAGWRNFYTLDSYNYLIQFNPEKNFRPLKEYEFQRDLPYKNDKIVIFVRDGKQDSQP